MRKLTLLSLTLFFSLAVSAQMVDPVSFSAQLKTNESATGEIIFTGQIDRGWHVYSTKLGNSGPTEATLIVNRLDGVKLIGELQPRGKEQTKFDEIFGIKVRYFEGTCQFVQKVSFTKPQYTIDCALEYGACNDETCAPPTEFAFRKSGQSPAIDKSADTSVKQEAKPSEEQPKEKLDAEEQNPTVTTDSTLTVQSSTLSADSLWWAPVDKAFNVQTSGLSAQHAALWYIFLMGFLGGLLALFTPCVWPIIPMTVSFFLKRSKDRSRGIRDAIAYGISIIAIYLTLGILVTAIFGPDTLNAMSTNVWFNLFLFALLVIFALSFFGWFEIHLPASWGNKVDMQASKTTGWLSIFLMAFTLALVSFSCTAPIVGLLLVETATSGKWLAPALGMFGFALALALPFTLFALFPAWLKQAPKSGSWMNIIKVSLGFIELAFSLKFLSVADLAYGWRILDREVFLALWIVIFGLLGLYLIGKLVFPSDGTDEKSRTMPVPCIMLGMLSLAFALYMVPGLWGAPCKAVSAFAPPMWTQDFNLNQHEVRALYTDYEKGMAAARAAGKPAFVDFTGFGCVNCRKMEAAVWTDPQVASLLENDYILISLFVDDKTPLEAPIEVDFNGEKRTLRTVGQKWSYLQATKFGANTQPFYCLLDNDGRLLAAPYSYDESISAYIDFLQQGLKQYNR